MIRSQRQSTSRPRGLHTELDFSFNVWGVSFFLESDNPLNLEPFVVTVQLNQNLKLSDTVPCVWLSFEIAKNTNQTTIPRRPCEYYPTVTCHCKSLWEEQSWAMVWAKMATDEGRPSFSLFFIGLVNSSSQIWIVSLAFYQMHRHYKHVEWVCSEG